MRWTEEQLKAHLENKGNKKKPKAKPKKKKIKVEPMGVKVIRRILKDLKVDFVEELKFSKKRRFRFDFAIPNMKVGIEYEGLNSAKSGHTTLVGYTSDCVKYNLAQLEGWIVLRYTAINYKEIREDLLTLINKQDEHREYRNK